MLYWLFRYLNENTAVPGMRVGEYISFRSAAAIILSLLIAIFAGKHIIRMLRRKQIGEDIRDLGLEGQLQKKGTPTMGGIIIILSLIIPVLLFGNLGNVYVQLMIISTLWLGFLGGLDDYIKVFRHNKEGLKGKFKIVGQVGLGIIVGTTMWLSDDIVIREKSFETYTYTITDDRTGEVVDSYTDRRVISTTPEKSLKTSIPFLKDTMLDYKVFTANNETLAWLLYIVVAIFVITAVSNGANLTDGIDGLLTGVSVPIVLVLGILAYLSGHIIYSDYLNIMYIPDSGELIVFAAAFVGALIGFLWYNSFPAQIFMGDTGSLTIGGIIAVFALCIRKELLLPLLCGVFLVEALSVMVQVSYFKYTKRKYGEGRRILLMSPIHHHYQKKGLFETKIMMRFFIISLMLAALTLVTLKIQ
ncbi:MAG: phospho-N-acetylmuramoyl-pentapeptide-transferase [Alistipes sp.]|nr:phospho-N-acetylmuramoyl-pentapeptide-transferase [Alistipes sp.]